MYTITMKILLYISVWICLRFDFHGAQYIDMDDLSISGKIVNGLPAQKGQFPFQAAVFLIPRHRLFCGGSLISQLFVLSAAHCFRDNVKAKNLLIKLGVVSAYFEKAVKRGVSQIFTHPEFTDYFDNDIALLKLDSPVPLGLNVNIIPLPHKSSKPVGECYVSGWGSTKSFSSTVQKLRYAIIPPYDHELCRLKYGVTQVEITKNMLCYGGKESDTCQGDSGGPLACLNAKGALFVAGITSFGSLKCAENDQPAIYTNVANYLDWIKSITCPNARSCQQIVKLKQ